MQAQSANGISLAELKTPASNIQEMSLTGAQKLSAVDSRAQTLGNGNSWIAEPSAQKAP